jgi:hypothetical protein
MGEEFDAGTLFIVRDYSHDRSITLLVLPASVPVLPTREMGQLA